MPLMLLWPLLLLLAISIVVINLPAVMSQMETDPFSQAEAIHLPSNLTNNKCMNLLLAYTWSDRRIVYIRIARVRLNAPFSSHIPQIDSSCGRTRKEVSKRMDSYVVNYWVAVL